ncbi:MAG: alpha-2-macroglobulin family protein [Flavisolibacter sp.]
MRSARFLLLVALSFFLGVIKTSGQEKTFDAEWKKVDALIQQKNLPRSALAEVRKIYNLARKQGQQAQLIKSLVYMTRLQQETREDNELASIRDIEKELAASREPATSLLNSLLAGAYWQYLQNHRWQLYGRTPTSSYRKEDLSTWTLEDLHRNISGRYLQSLEHAALLKKIPASRFDPIVIRGNTPGLRPTLFDLVAHQALAYFVNNERDITKPAYAFEISQVEAFAPASQFIRFPFTSPDSLSLEQKALKLYQELMAFHLQDAVPDALIDLDIDRISFVYNHSVQESKDSLYVSALKNLMQSHPDNKALHQAGYLLAVYYNQQAASYDPLRDSAHHYDRVRARDLLEKIVHDSALKNEGWVNSYNLLQEIRRPSFSFQVEKVNLPDQPFRALVSYTQTTQLRFRLVQTPEHLQRQLEEADEESFWKILETAPPFRTWDQALPVTGDLQEHRVEIKIDSLPIGSYMLLASIPAVDPQKATLGAQAFFVSDISYVNQGRHFFVLHRQTGQPLAGAAVQVYNQAYDNKMSRFVRKLLGNYETDPEGSFTLAGKEDRNYPAYYLKLRAGQDSLDLRDASPVYRYKTNEEEADTGVRKTFFFTDRSLYRPGQTVYFKGIVVSGTGRGSSIASGFPITVFLKNANGELVDSLHLTTNAFGSCSGSFQLPRQGLNGSFSLQDAYGAAYSFSVEEYKRPRFQVDLEKVQNSYQLMDTISLTGRALAYAGNRIEGARVRYRVVRRSRFLYTGRFRGWQPPSPAMEIAHGETIVDTGGRFGIRFTAIPDRKISPATQPVFDYAVYADVTDGNGETRSAEGLVSAGYSSLLVKTAVASRIPLDSLSSLRIRTENMNGIFQPAVVSLRFTALQPEQRLIRSRYWTAPDQFLMDRASFIGYFPHDEYRSETDATTWPRGSLVWEESDSSRSDAVFPLRNPRLPAGFYELALSTRDKEGHEVKDVRYVELFEASSPSLNKPEYLWTRTGRSPLEPGETALTQVGSSASGVHLIREINRISEKENFSYASLNQEKKSFSYPIKETDRGGFGVNYFFVKDNRFYQLTDILSVPWTNKELQVEYASFRDRTLPGSQEKWEVNITGYQKEKVAAEVLVSMYDASLDQFKPHQWDKPAPWPVFAQTFPWQGNQNFSALSSREKSASIDYRNFEKNYDHLNFEFGGQPGVLMEMRLPYARALGGKVAGISLQQKIADSTQADEVAIGYAGAKAPAIPAEAPVQARKDFRETAFFFPDLRTDEKGSVRFSFTVPEALTRWKWQTLAHTKELAFGLSSKELITQKPLMVQPNAPRFLRQGDHLEFSTKIVNLSDSEITGQVQLELLNATTGQSVDGWFINAFPNQYFTVGAGQSEVVSFPLQVPYQFSDALVWRVTARSGNLSDGEENILPVLTNKILVTESLPISMKGSGQKSFHLEHLLQSGASETLQHQSLAVEYTSNPSWYAVQALPYLMEFPYECAEQVWNRYYANALATQITRSSPTIRQVFASWKTADTTALLSSLQKNPELQSALLEETPWVLEARSEQEQKQHLGVLFDPERLESEAKANWDKLAQMQSSNGGFVWFPGGPDDRYITQYILSGMGHLEKMQGGHQVMNPVTKATLDYLDKKITGDYAILARSSKTSRPPAPAYLQVQYLYARSFFPGYPLPKTTQEAYHYFFQQVQKQWMHQNPYMQGMIALVLHRSGDSKGAAAILQSLKERAVRTEEMGMYWKDPGAGFKGFWWQAPIETQALLIEAFSEISGDRPTVDALKTWLIKNKQTNHWATTKATADACYALLEKGSPWLDTTAAAVSIRLGNKVISTENQEREAGTGYFKKQIEPGTIRPDMGNITVNIRQPGEGAQPSWGAVYWQYFEDLDKIRPSSTPLALDKKLFLEKNTDRGPVLVPVEGGTVLHTGDKIKVRIELHVDRDMEYVHLKDMRAPAMEPLQVLSGYQWQGGLGYYESTRDAGTDFFIHDLRKGSYVFEYPLFLTHTGSFSAGLATIQCMYAPEFSAHSGDTRIEVE